MPSEKSCGILNAVCLPVNSAFKNKYEKGFYNVWLLETKNRSIRLYLIIEAVTLYYSIVMIVNRKFTMFVILYYKQNKLYVHSLD